MIAPQEHWNVEPTARPVTSNWRRHPGQAMRKRMGSLPEKESGEL
jgi:hypothetical protein